MSVETDVDTLLIEAGWKPSVDRKGASLPFARREGGYWIVNGRPNGVDDHVGVAGPGAEFSDPVELARALIERAVGARQRLAESIVAAPVAPPPEPEETCAPPVVEPDPDIFDDPVPDERDDEIDALRDEIAELRAQLEAERGARRFPASLDEKLGDYADVEAENALTTDDLFDLMGRDMDGAQDVIGKLSGHARKRFTELLNVELAELQQARGGKGENFKREADIEKMLGLFARAGEV